MKSSPEMQPTETVHDENILKHLDSFDDSQDVGAKVVSLTVARLITPAENTKVLRRIDLVLMPLMFISYGLQYMDKAILGSAAQFGIIQDLGLADVTIVNGKTSTSLVRFSYCTLIFYWGFLAGCLPCAYLAQRFPIGRFCGIAIAVWGGLTMVTAAVTSYPGLMVLRFFLGFVEGAIPSSFSLIVAMWYKKDEQPLRLALWIAASGFGSVVGSIAIWGIGHVNGALHPWQYQFLILGAITILWGVAMIFVLPENPVKAKFLSEEDRVIAVERMRIGQTGIENTKFKWYQVKEGLLDIKTWASVVIIFCVQLTNGAASGFGSVIVASLGFNPFQSVLLQGALGAVVFVTLPIGGVICLYVRNMRLWIAAFSTLPMITGATLLWKSSWLDNIPPLIGFILLGFFTLPYLMVIALMTANTAGHTKKAFTSAMLWGAYCVTNGVAPLLVKTTEITEHYPTLCAPLISVLCVGFVSCISLRFYLMWENKRRDQIVPVDEISHVQTAFADMTDKENPNFRYSY